MSEKIPKRNEHLSPISVENTTKSKEFNPTIEKSSDNENLKKEKTIESLKKHIDQIAVSSDTKDKESKTHHERPHHYITKDIKNAVYVHTLNNVRLHLKPGEQVFSKVIHNNVIESISEVGAKTIARPSLIIGGGIVMILGGIFLFIVARYYGFVLPFSTLIALYIIGFFVVLVVDLIKVIITKSRK